MKILPLVLRVALVGAALAFLNSCHCWWHGGGGGYGYGGGGSYYHGGGGGYYGGRGGGYCY